MDVCLNTSQIPDFQLELYMTIILVVWPDLPVLYLAKITLQYSKSNTIPSEWLISRLADEEEQPVGNVTEVDAIPLHNE